MTCSRCGGFLWAPDPERGPYCANCGRSQLPPPTKEQLQAAGINMDSKNGHEVEGLHRQGLEFNPVGGGFARMRSYQGSR